MSDRLRPVLDRILADHVPPNVGLMTLLCEARSVAEAADALRRAAAEGPDGGAARAMSDLLARHPDAFAAVRTVMAEADHADGLARGPAHWAGVFDRLAAAAPDSAVALYSLGSPDLLAAASAEVVALLSRWGALRPGARVLEIGCGTGRLSRPIAAVAAAVIGLDVSAGMVAEARRRSRGIANLRFARSSGHDLAEIADGSQDLVLAADVFPYLVEAGLAADHVREAYRVLGPGGALAILNWSYQGGPEQARREAGAAIRAGGFVLERDGARDLRLWDAAGFLGRKPG